MSLGPYVEKMPFSCIFVSNISGASSAYKINEKTITLSFTEEAAISQVTATKAITVQPFEFAKFEGELKLNPETDFYYSERLVPTTTNQVNDITGLNGLVNTTTADPNIQQIPIFPSLSSAASIFASSTPANEAQFSGILQSATRGTNVPVINEDLETVWGVQNAEPANFSEAVRLVDGMRPISSLVEHFGVDSDRMVDLSAQQNPTVVETSIGLSTGLFSTNSFDSGKLGRVMSK